MVTGLAADVDPSCRNQCVGKGAAETFVGKQLKAGCKGQLCSFQHTAGCINKSILETIESKYEY